MRVWVRFPASESREHEGSPGLLALAYVQLELGLDVSQG